MGSFSSKTCSESTRLVKRGIREGRNCRPGARFLKKAVGKRGKARYSFWSAHKGIQVVPRKNVVFRPERTVSQGVFIFVRSEKNGKRITQGL